MCNWDYLQSCIYRIASDLCFLCVSGPHRATFSLLNVIKKLVLIIMNIFDSDRQAAVKNDHNNRLFFGIAIPSSDSKYFWRQIALN